VTNQLNRCKAKNKRGEPCQASATDNGFCYFHANPGVAAELGRRGGRRNRHVDRTQLLPLPSLGSTGDVKNALEQTIADLRQERLPARMATGLSSLFNTLLRVFPSAEAEEELKLLKERIKALELAKAK